MPSRLLHFTLVWSNWSLEHLSPRLSSISWVKRQPKTSLENKTSGVWSTGLKSLVGEYRDDTLLVWTPSVPITKCALFYKSFAVYNTDLHFHRTFHIRKTTLIRAGCLLWCQRLIAKKLLRIAVLSYLVLRFFKCRCLASVPSQN